MSIPLATTTIEITGVRPESSVDPEAAEYDPGSQPTPAVLWTGVRACISEPRGYRGQRDSGEDGEQIDYLQLRCDRTVGAATVDLRQWDQVKDLSTGLTYAVDKVVNSATDDFGLDHFHAQLRTVKGTP